MHVYMGMKYGTANFITQGKCKISKLKAPRSSTNIIKKLYLVGDSQKEEQNTNSKLRVSMIHFRTEK